MSASNILLRTGANAGKINPDLIVGGGAGIVDSVNASAGIHIDNADPVNPIVQIGTNQAGDLIVGTAVQYVGAVLPQGGNGTYLGVNGGVLGYSVPPQQGIAYTQEGQMLYAGVAPAFADTLLNIGNAGQVLGVNAGVPTWSDVGGSGLITANLPLIEDADPAPNSKISINFSNAVGEIPYGTATKVGALTNVPQAGQILGMAGNPSIPTWIDAGGSGTITALAPLTEYAVGTASNVAINFTAKGDLVVGGGAQVGGHPIAGVIFPVGANDQVLICNSNTASGLEWVASGGGSSATIFRNSQDNTPLLISKPLTANDTCVITSDRVFDTFNQVIYNPPLVGGFPSPTNSFQFFPWSPATNVSITSMNVNVKLSSTAIAGTQMSVALTAYNDPTTIYSTSDPTPVLGEGIYNFINFDNLPYEVVGGGGQYSFFVLITLAPGDTYENFYIDPQDPTSYVGNITVVGIDYPVGAVATFLCPPQTKFRVPLDLVGKQSATCESFASQSFVATADANDWIMVGGQNGGVAFIP